jgi:hypothetical protein
MPRFAFCAATAALGALAVSATAAPDDQEKKEIEDLRREMAEMKKSYEGRISELEKRLGDGKDASNAALQKEIDELVDRVDAFDSKLGAVKSAAGGGRTAYLDVSFNSLLTAGTSTASESVLPELEGGHHDPHKRGFTVQNTELGLSGAVDPYFKGFANMVQTIDKNGETVVELEEAYAKTTALPYGLQVKAGQFFTEFGRLNPQHPHQWEFVDQPVVNTRMFGDDGMRGPGAQVSWLAPTKFPLEVLGSVQNANGNTMRSFAGPAEDGPPVGVQHEHEVKSLADVVYSARADASFDLSEEAPALLGASYAYGPSGASSSGSTSILGADLTVKWKPLANDHGFPFVAFQSEWMRRHVGYDSFVDGTTFTPGGELRDSGEYAQLVYGFHRDWTAGARFDRVHGTNDDVLGAEDRDRWSAALTWYASEFAKIRLQVNFDDSKALDRWEQSVWLQLEFNLGVHGAHKF